MNGHKSAWVLGAGKLIDILEAAQDTDRVALARLIQVRLAQPQAFVTVVGETSTGKSSLINAMLAQDLLPTDARPTTGVVTHIVCRNEPEPRFMAVYRDATQASLDREQFVELSLKPEDDVLRLQVRAAPRKTDNIGLNVFDTPGYNSMLSQHEEVLMSFLPQSDVIVFVVGHRTGFGQTDQDLLEAVAVATEHDRDIPVLLVVNRAPSGVSTSDKRVAEILRLATDGLHRSLGLQIVPSSNHIAADGTVVAMPLQADVLWNDVHRLAMDPQRLAAVQIKLERELIMVLDDAETQAAREEARWSANDLQRQEIAQTLDRLEQANEESLHEITKTMTNLEIALPHLLKRMTENLKLQIANDVNASGRWLGHADCAEWLSGHLLPYEVRSIGRAVEDHMATELNALNKRLEDIANTTVAELDKSIALRGDDPVRQFTINVASTLSSRLAGNAASSILRGMGGVGGAAAGAGNLAKMIVKRTGQLFGKTFGREVYKQIGRVFTKKMMERLNVALTVLIEVVGYLREVQVWQGKLIERSNETIDIWCSQVALELINQQLPSMLGANQAIVDDLYQNMIDPSSELDQASSIEREENLATLHARRNQLLLLRRKLTNPTSQMEKETT